MIVAAFGEGAIKPAMVDLFCTVPLHVEQGRELKEYLGWDVEIPPWCGLPQ